MPYEAKVFSILIASPSDVHEEREIAVRAIQEWNELHSSNKQIVLLPIRWETHTTPEYGSRPQEAINRQIVDQCDLLIGIFWTRLGTPTGKNESGTLEEIDRVASQNKPVMLYFSRANTDPDKIDTEQLNKLREFKKKTYNNALIETFNNQIEFKDKLSKQIERQILRIKANGVDGFDGKMESSIFLELFDIDRKINCGTNHEINTIFLDVVNKKEIPDYESKSDDVIKSTFTLDLTNKDYYRELVNYKVANNLFSPVDFWLKNTGSLGAKDLYVVLSVISDTEEIEFISGLNFNTEPPTRTRDRFLISKSNNSIYQETLEIERVKSQEWKISFELYALQPKREVDAGETLFIGAKKSCELMLNAKIYADSLPEPISQTLKININVKHQKVTYQEIINESTNS